LAFILLALRLVLPWAIQQVQVLNSIAETMIAFIGLEDAIFGGSLHQHHWLANHSLTDAPMNWLRKTKRCTQNLLTAACAECCSADRQMR